MPKKVTLKFLADRLGLSKSAVSSVLNNAPLARSFTPQTRERIFTAAKQYNYKPNYFARYLNQQRSYLIGVIAPDLAEGYDASVLGGIEEYLLQSDYRFFLATHEWSKSRIDRTIQIFLERGVDGLILINTSLSSPVDLPLVVIGKGNRIKSAISITIDNHAGIRSAIEHLVSLGHSKIAFIKGHKDSADTEDRWKGIVAAARSLSISKIGDWWCNWNGSAHSRFPASKRVRLALKHSSLAAVSSQPSWRSTIALQSARSTTFVSEDGACRMTSRWWGLTTWLRRASFFPPSRLSNNLCD